MSPDSENFDQLRKLLALKRHEQPPPGFFDHFSKDVMLSIRAGRPGSKDLGEILESVPWLARLFSLFETKPFFAGAFGVGVCALLISGIVYSEQWTPAPVATISAPVVSSAALASATPISTDAAESGRMQAIVTTNASLLEAQTLFQRLQVKSSPVNFSMPATETVTPHP